MKRRAGFFSRFFKRTCKRLAILLLVLLLIIILLLFLCYLTLGTDKGFRFSVDQIQQRVDGLEIGDISGNLSKGIKTDTVDFKNDKIALQAQGIDTQWRTGCLIEKEVCLDKVVIDNLKIETFDTGETKTASTDDIELPDIKLPVGFNVKEILVKNLEFQAPGGAPLQTVENIKLSAHSEGDTLNIDELSTQYQNINVNASGWIMPKDGYPLDLNIDIEAADILEKHDISTNIKLSDSLENLKINAQTDGAVKLDIQGEVQPLKKKLPANLAINTAQIGWELDTMAVAKATDLAIIVDGDMDDYKFTVNTDVIGEQIPKSELRLIGKANTSRAELSDLTAYTLGGVANGSAAVSWEDGIKWEADLITKNINPGVKFKGADAKLNSNIVAKGELIDGKWTLDLQQASVEGLLRDVPFALDTKLQKQADNTWALDSLALNNGNNRVNAKGTLTDKWDVTADIDMPELNNLLPDLTGGFKANIDMQGEIETPDVQLTASTDTIKFKETEITGLKLNADVKRGALDDSRLALTIANVKAGEQAIMNTRLNLDGSREKHTIKLFADGPQKTSVDLLASGGLTEKFDWNGALTDVTLEVPAHEIILRNKTNLAWNNETKKFSVDPHCWGLQESNLCLKNKVLAEDKGKAIIELDNYGLKQLNPFLAANSELLGQLNTMVTLDWGEDIPGGYAAVLAADVSDGAISIEDPNGLPLTFEYETLTLKTTADSTALKSKLTIDSQTMGQALVNFNLDPTSENKPISGNVDLSGFQLGFIKAFLPNYDELTAVLSTKGAISGELLDPLYNGNVVIDDIKVMSDDLPLPIDDGTITATINGKRAVLDGNLLSGNGSVGVDGTANWLNKTYRADINVKTDKLTIKQDPITDSIVDAKITLAIKPNDIRVRGNIEIPVAEIDIKELPKGAAIVSEDVIIVEDIYAETLSKQEKKAAPSILDVKVTVSLGNDVNLTGYGLNANLTGDLSVNLVGANPVQLGGEVRIPTGTFKKYGQDLEITDGRLQFVGPIDQTSLNIEAVRTIDESSGNDSSERVAGLAITGRIEDPDISLFTDPADKTQESILSYIVLGRDLGGDGSRAGSSQDDVLKAAALAFTLKNGKGITDKFAGALGVQDLTLDAKGSGESTELIVSSRINDRLLVRYGQNVLQKDAVPTLYLRYDLTKQLYVEAAGGLIQAVDIFYKFAF